MEGNEKERLRNLDYLQREVEVSLVSVQRHLSVASDSADKLARRVARLVEKVEAGEPRFQELLASQLRMDETLSIIRSMLERQQGQ